MKPESRQTGLEIAIIGMSGRFPGAQNIDRFWENLKNGVESIAFFSDEEIKEAGIDPLLLENPYFVRSGGGMLEDRGNFDASFFGYSAVEAELMDPQVRIFHECAWHALENAGYDPFSYGGLIGIYAGTSFNLYWEVLSWFSGHIDKLGNFAALLVMDRDYLCTRVSYHLNLKGPSVVVKTACSTSLVAVHMACQAILNGECDMALAGGGTIVLLRKCGYLYQEGMIFSADGHCRAFDLEAKGIVNGDGVGIVVLKRLEDAIKAGDNIHAVIKGTAINNDGIRKAGYTAPSVVGQAEVISEAYEVAEVDPETITYIETHGTGTPVGDPIEIEALRMAFNTDKKRFCKIGSVKSNIGHLDAAAGIGGLIKTILALKHKLIPPSLHFETPNPKIDFENSPFCVNTELVEWEGSGYPLRAGVSSFGIGGTNVHVVLEEAPEGTRGLAPLSTRQYQLILLSARTPTALDKMTENLTEYLKKNIINPGNPGNPTNPGQKNLLNRGNHENPGNHGPTLADAAYTLQVGRRVFPHRRMLVGSDLDSVVEALSSPEPGKHPTFHLKEENTSAVFMFPGLGAQYIKMGLGLYETEPVFQEEMDRCFEILKSITDYNIKEVLYPASRNYRSNKSNNSYKSNININHFEVAQVVVFILEYALAKLLMNWGVKPHAMIGYSFGEYTAACLSGVFSPEDALKLVVFRGQLIDRGPGGAMLSVPLTAEELTSLIPGDLSLAIDNGPSCIVSGPCTAVDAFEKQLKEKKYLSMRVPNSHALHSKMMEPILKEYEAHVGSIKLNRPQIPYISNVTGTWITVREAVEPGYWARHLRQTVRFAEGINQLKKELNPIFIEIGPGRDLCTLLVRHREENSQQQVFNLLRQEQQQVPDDRYLLNKIGHLWLHGIKIDWKQFYGGEKRYRIPLPLYPFDQQYYWLEGDPYQMAAEMSPWGSNRQKKNSFYLPSWEPSVLSPGIPGPAPEKMPENSKAKHQRPELSTDYAPPTDETEAMITQIWQEFLGIDGVGIYDDFLELGADSLVFVTIASRLHKALDVNVPIPEFFSRLNIKGMAEYIREAKKEKYAAIKPVEKKEYYVMSSAQKRTYFLQQMDEQGIAYNIPSVFSWGGEMDKGGLEDTFKRLIMRHESLRTSFEMIGGQPVQKIHEHVEFKMEYYDLNNGKPHPGTDSCIKNCIRHFDLSHAPLLRVGLITETENRRFLVVDMHHIISDGVSISLLIKELMAFYSGEDLQRLRIMYKDFSKWQDSREVKEWIEQQEKYWLKEFAEEIPVLNLPGDFSRPAIQSFEGARIDFEIGKMDTTALKTFALDEGATLFMLLLTLYNIFLSKLSGQEDIVVGTPVAGRRHNDLENIIGIFINTLALRNFPNGEKTFKQFLNETKNRTLQAFANQDYQYEELVERVKVNRDVSRNPLFDIMFILQNFDIPEAEFAGISLKPYPYDQGISRFDLSLWGFEIDGTLVYTLEYCTNLFKPATIERFVNYFKKIISTVIENPGVNISDIQVISEEEKTQLLFDFNAAVSDYPREKSIQQLFEEQVNKMPGNIAIVFEDKHLSYKMLNQRSNQLASMLRQKGAAMDMIIGIMVKRSLEMLMGIMAILKAGSAYLPIDPGYPHERIDYMLKDSGAKILVTTGIFEKEVKKLRIWEGKKGLETCYLDSYISFPLLIPDLPNFLTSNPINLAYIIYTSGSTGKPKGVLVEHRSMVNACTWQAEYYNITYSDRGSQFASFGFDASVLEVFPYLIRGAVVYIIAEEMKLDPVQLNRYFEDNQITISFLPTQICERFMELDNHSLKVLITAGDRLVTFKQRRYTLYNNYGPTENTVVATSFQVDKEYDNIPIGKPIANNRIYILNPGYLNIQPVGVAGELCISGASVARGYLNRPELTAEKFIVPSASRGSFEKRVTCPMDPAKLLFNHQSPLTIYRTGDLAHWLPDRNIGFLGRIDRQVKIRGFRIELGEIESQLLKHEGIKEAVVLVKKDTEDKKYLSAYIVSDMEFNVSRLREYLSVELPDYMIPANFIQVEKIPLNPNGKVDKRTLENDGSRLETGGKFEAPQNDIEGKMVEVWKEVLHADKVGVRDNFFDLGGNSVDIIKVNSRLREIFKKDIPVVIHFRYTTIKSFVQYLGQEAVDSFHTSDRTEALKRGEQSKMSRLKARRGVVK